MASVLSTNYAELRHKTFRVLVDPPITDATPWSQMLNYFYNQYILDELCRYTQLRTVRVTTMTPIKGTRNSTTGKWTGKLGYLYDDEVDLLLEPFSMSEERIASFDFLPPVYHQQYGFHVSENTMKAYYGMGSGSSSGGFLSFITFESTFGALGRVFIPFLSLSWIGIVAALLLVAFQCMLFEFLHPKPFENLSSNSAGDSDDDKPLPRLHKQMLLLASLANVGDPPPYVLWRKTLRRLSPKRSASKEKCVGIGQQIESVVLHLCESAVGSIDQFLRPLVNQGPTLSPTSTASQMILTIWCLACVLLTAMYTANLTAIFGITHSPLQPPFNNISSLDVSKFIVLVEKGSAAEALLRWIHINLNGTRDGEAMGRILARSEQHWLADMDHYGEKLFDKSYYVTTNDSVRLIMPKQHEHFALLAGHDLAGSMQDEKCGLHPIPFSYPLDARPNSVLVDLPERRQAYALRKNSTFTEPLSQMITILHNMGTLDALRKEEWKTLMKIHRISDGLRYQCVSKRPEAGKKTPLTLQQIANSKTSTKARLTLRELLPTFTLFALCSAFAVLVFATECGVTICLRLVVGRTG